MKKEVFDLVKESVAHVMQQGGPSFTRVGDSFRYKSSPKIVRCAYMAPNGRRCAAGIFIKKYDPDMEGFGWPALSNDTKIPERALDARARRHSVIVGKMQQWHDNATTGEDDDDAFMKSYISNVRMGMTELSPAPKQRRELEALLMSYRRVQE